MKSLFLTISKKAAVLTTLAFLLVSPFQPLVAQADTPDPNNPTAYYGQDNAGGTASPVSQGFGGQTAAGVTAPASANNPPVGNDTPTSNCSIWGNGSLNPFSNTSGGDLAQCFTDVIYVFTIGIGSGFAYVAAYFFDWSVALSLNGTAYALDFVSQGWTTARDIANMAFLFILLYIAFKIMFQAETNETVHMLSLVIVIALLVNFSFFFTRLAIDAGNILAIQFYNAIDVPSVGDTSKGNGVQATAASTITSGIGYAGTPGVLNGGTTGFNNSKDLTSGIMGMLNLQGLLGNSSFQAFRSGNNYNFLTSFITLSFLYISAGIMLWLLTVAFITNGVKFLIRIVVLWFLIIASPLAFVARAVPKFEEYYKKWQNALIQHAFYPVAFMFIFLILTNFAKQMGAQNALINDIFNAANTGTASSTVAGIGYAVANVGIRMGFVLAMLYIGMEASKRIGIMGADAANHAGEWVGSKLVGTYGRVGGFAGRNTVGWAGDVYAKSATGRNWAAQGGWFGRTAWRAAGAASRQSYDVRGGLAALGVKENIIGKAGGEGGYAAAFDARVKRREEEAKKLKPLDSQTAKAVENAIEALDPEDKKMLVNAADHYASIKQANIDGDATQADVKEAKKQYDDIAKWMGVNKLIKEQKEKMGSENTKKYASSISTKTWRNLYGAGQGTPLWISRAEKEAAEKIRDSKNDAFRVKNILVKMGYAPEDATLRTPRGGTGGGVTGGGRGTGGGSGGGGTGGGGGSSSGGGSGGSSPRSPGGGPAVPMAMQQHRDRPDSGISNLTRESMRRSQYQAQEAQQSFNNSVKKMTNEIRQMRREASSSSQNLRDIVRGFGAQTSHEEDSGSSKASSQNGNSQAPRAQNQESSSSSAQAIADAASKINTVKREEPPTPDNPIKEVQ